MMQWDNIGIKDRDNVFCATALRLHELYSERIAPLLADALDLSRAQLAKARDEALEDAAQVVDAAGHKVANMGVIVLSDMADQIRSLKSLKQEKK